MTKRRVDKSASKQRLILTRLAHRPRKSGIYLLVQRYNNFIVPHKILRSGDGTMYVNTLGKGWIPFDEAANGKWYAVKHGS